MREIGGDATRWGDTEHLLATLIDVTAHLTYLFRAANFKGDAELPPPLRRPGQPDPTVRMGGKRSYTSKEVDEIRARMTPMAAS